MPEHQAVPPGREPAMIPLSALNQFLFCPRRAALIHVEGIFRDNEHTLRGDIAHEHADLPGFEAAKGVTLLRALPIWSETLGLSGKCDIVEKWPDGTLFPVEFKLGKRRKWDNDDVQLCAQALCLEEMFQIVIPRGAIFHADSKRRREVDFTPALRQSTQATAREVHALIASGRVPSAIFKPACEECSLYDICLPKVSDGSGRVARLASTLFETSR